MKEIFLSTFVDYNLVNNIIMKNFTISGSNSFFWFSQLVTTNSQLATAITNANAGGTIILANGIGTIRI
jgi:hypothetical protein